MAFTTKLHGSTLPQTNFATRKLAFYSIALSGVDTNYDAVGSRFQLAVQGVQQIAELYAVGQPAGGAFVVVLSEDTITDNGSGAAAMLDAAVTAATGTSTTVTELALYGNGLSD
jgi:hypothetical protein